MIQDLSGSLCIKGTNESVIRVDSSVPLMHNDPDRQTIYKHDLGVELGPTEKQLQLSG